jgi:uncharacterized protein (TIGR03067 family)
MNIRLQILAGMIFAALLATAGAQTESPSRLKNEPVPESTEPTKLEGNWEVARIEGGVPDQAKIFQTWKFNFAGNTLTVAVPGADGRTVDVKFRFSLPPDTKPQHIDLSIIEGTDAGQKFFGVVEPGEDALKLAMSATDRPADFDAAKKTVGVMHLRRVKKSDE